MHRLLTVMLSALLAFALNVNAQNYKLVWEDNFESGTLDATKWNVDQRIGIWNTGGNRELQHYAKDNVRIGQSSDGNSCLILTAKREEYNGYQFTSGKVTTKGKFAFRRGKLEASIKMPDLANGLWPAFWTLGYTQVGWPDCGEIDVLEMGQAAGISQGKPNSYIGAHLHWGPYPRNYGTSYVAPYDLSTGFFKYSVVWTENLISVYFHDNPTPYFQMNITGDDTEEYRDYKHYIILNLAVGGSLTGLFSPNDITAPMPAEMYVDWVRVYQLEENEDFGNEELPLYGMFGVYEENPSVDMRMDLGFDLTEQSIGLTQRSGETPQSGSKVLSYHAAAGNEFDLRLSAALKRNMVNYENGSVQFFIKTDSETDINIGVADWQGNSGYLTFGANANQNFERDGDWQRVFIPLNEMKVQGVNLTELKDMLVVKGEFASNDYLSIDEVIFSENVPLGGIFGIYTNNPIISDKFLINNVTGHLYNWSNTVAFNQAYPAYEGEDVLSFRSSGAAGWWGFGIFSSSPLNLESYANGYLNLAMRTNSTQAFNIAIHGAGETQGSVTFNSANDSKYGFVRDGRWHKISIPIAEMVAQGLDLSASGNIFTISGSTIGDIAVDDIYLSEFPSELENPALCYPVSLTVSPKTSSIREGSARQFTARATDQFGNPTDAYVTWAASGGHVENNGLFTSETPGTFTVFAELGYLTDSAVVTVTPRTDVKDLDNLIKVRYNNSEKNLYISGIENETRVVIASITGAVLYNENIKHETLTIDMGRLPQSVYLVRIVSGQNIITRKIVNR